MALRSTSILVSLLLLSVSARAGAAAEPPKIAKPRSAMALPITVQPLPPAQIDNALAVGGDEVKGKEVDTRLTVDVRVNGRGPYHFIVDSGADTSAVGLRIARDLELPLGTPSILDGTVSRDIVDCVKVSQLTLGPSVISDLELPALKEESSLQEKPQKLFPAEDLPPPSAEEPAIYPFPSPLKTKRRLTFWKLWTVKL